MGQVERNRNELNPTPTPTSQGKVYLLSDKVTDHKNANPGSRSLEVPEAHYIEALINALDKSRRCPVHLESPRKLLEQDVQPREPVLSIWSGSVSRNRRILVPALCETLDLFLVGADAYASIVSQDKIIARELASAAGFNVPPATVLWRADQQLALDQIQPPYVVKPSREGTSIGIESTNLMENKNAVREKAQTLIKSLQQPILVESFIGGDESSINLIETPEQKLYISPTRTTVPGKKDFFANAIYSAEIKKFDQEPTLNTYAPDLVDATPLNAVKRFLNILSPVRYMRIDGRWSEGAFWFVESSPDTHLGPKEAFARAFTDRGLSYSELIDSLIMQDFTAIERIMPWS